MINVRLLSTLALAIAITLCLPSCSLNRKTTLEPNEKSKPLKNIINGTDSDSPATGALMSTNGQVYDQQCTGTLVCSDVVITAGHCRSLTHFTLDSGKGYQNGINKIPLPPNSAGILQKTESTVVAGEGDTIALFKLDKEINASFPSISAVSPSVTSLKVVGYGNYYRGPSQPFGYGQRKEAQVKVTSVSEQSIKIAAGITGSHPTSGDSGGPYFDSNGLLVAIHRGGTGKLDPSIPLTGSGMHVKDKLAWIHEQMSTLCSGQVLYLNASATEPDAGTVTVKDDVNQSRINCGASGAVCADTYKISPKKPFILIDATASPKDGYEFDRWEGICSEVRSNKCKFGLNRSSELRAIFKPKLVKLTLNKQPGTKGAFVSVISGKMINPCDLQNQNSCVILVHAGLPLTLSFPFLGGGTVSGCSLNGTQCTFTPSNDLTLTLSFGPSQTTVSNNLIQLFSGARRPITAAERTSYLPLVQAQAVPISLLQVMVQTGSFLRVPCTAEFASNQIAQTPQKSPIHRLYNSKIALHHFTAADAEKTGLIQSTQWTDEKIAFHTNFFPASNFPNAPQVKVLGYCWTSNSVLEINQLLRTTILRPAIDYTVLRKNSADFVPLFRLYNPNGGQHYLTTNAVEAMNLVKLSWILEQTPGNQGYLSQTYHQIDPQIYGLYNTKNGNRIYTHSKAYFDSIIQNPAFKGIWVPGPSLN